MRKLKNLIFEFIIINDYTASGNSYMLQKNFRKYSNN